MSALFWLLLIVAPVIAVGYVIREYRSKAASKEAASRERYAMLLATSRSATPPGGAAQDDQPGVVAAPAALAIAARPTVPAASPAPSAPAPSTAPARSSDRFLSQPETLLYYVLKAGLPEHEVFPRVALSSVLGGADSRSPVKSLREDLDFLICEKSMRPVAAVLLDGRVSAPVADVMDRALGAAGVRLARVNPAALPKREAVRALIFGA